MRSFKRKFSARDRRGWQARKRVPQTRLNYTRKNILAYKRKANRMVIAGGETKVLFKTYPDNTAITHNNFITLESSVFSTISTAISNDVTLEKYGGVSGNRYYAKGVSFRFMLENPQDRPYVIYRFMVIRAAHGNTPTRANLFEGASGNKMIDYIDKDKFTVEYQKWIHVKAPNIGSQAAANANGTILLEDALGYEGVVTQPKKVCKLYWPCNKYIRLHDYADRETIDGVANRQRSKDFDWHVLIYAYDTYGTPQDLTTVGRVNDYCSKVYAKDY